MYAVIIQKIEAKIKVVQKIYDIQIKKYENSICTQRPWGDGLLLQKADKISIGKLKLQQALSLIKEAQKEISY